MGKFSDFFKMSKQERTGAWMIALLIVVLLVAVFVERKCSSDDVECQSQSSKTEYIEKAEKSTPKVKKKGSKKSTKQDTKKGDSKKSTGKKTDKVKKSSSKTTKKSAKKTDKNQGKVNKSTQKRQLQPVPQF